VLHVTLANFAFCILYLCFIQRDREWLYLLILGRHLLLVNWQVMVEMFSCSSYVKKLRDTCSLVDLLFCLNVSVQSNILFLWFCRLNFVQNEDKQCCSQLQWQRKWMNLSSFHLLVLCVFRQIHWQRGHQHWLKSRCTQFTVLIFIFWINIKFLSVMGLYILLCTNGLHG